MAVGAVGAALLASCANPFANNGPDPHSAFADHLRAEPTMPVVVPRSLPDGYELGGAPTFQKDADGHVFMASWEYIPTASADAGLPVMILCVARPQVSVEDVCVPANHEPVAMQAVDGLSVALVPIGPGPDDAAVPVWQDVELTTDWRAAAWLHR